MLLNWACPLQENSFPHSAKGTCPGCRYCYLRKLAIYFFFFFFFFSFGSSVASLILGLKRSRDPTDSLFYIYSFLILLPPPWCPLVTPRRALLRLGGLLGTTARICTHSSILYLPRISTSILEWGTRKAVR